jgi:hypothetical protein
VTARKMCEINEGIKETLTIGSMDYHACKEWLNKLSDLNVTPLMMKMAGSLMLTLKKV